jgi:site-specific recombinase XerD
MRTRLKDVDLKNGSLSQLDRTQLFRVFQAVAEVTGLPGEKRHPHVLKHSLASHLVAGNVNLALVKQALGHRSTL